MKDSSNSSKPQSKPIWIDTPQGLDQLLAALSTQTVIAVDTESDSLFSYYEKVCLIQFSTSKTDYLLDPLHVDISTLAGIFANSSLQKVFHAAEYDILSLKRDFNFTFANLFDTMLAARILGWPRYGLGSILEEQFGVKLDKRFQRYNWGQRPLSKQALDYARLDTHYLLPLREVQLEALAQQNRLREAAEAFARQIHVEPTPKTFDPNDFWRIKGSKDLAPQQQAVLQELFILRDKISRKIDRPPFKVVNDSTLVRLAETQPKDYQALKEIKGLSGNLLKYNAQDVLQAIEAGKTVPPPVFYPHNNHRPDDDTLARYESLRQWRNNLAAKRGVEPDVIMSNDTLMDIARRNPKNLKSLNRLKSLGAWQAETYGRAVMQVLQETA
jgi:ribonuclease D